jgi:Zn finger protein HypA/HybF involved in hydrogenase expression
MELDYTLSMIYLEKGLKMNTSYYKREGREPFNLCARCERVIPTLKCPKCKSSRMTVNGSLEYKYNYSEGDGYSVITYPPETFDLSFKCEDCHHTIIVNDREIISACHALVSYDLSRIAEKDKKVTL